MILLILPIGILGIIVTSIMVAEVPNTAAQTGDIYIDLRPTNISVAKGSVFGVDISVTPPKDSDIGVSTASSRQTRLLMLGHQESKTAQDITVRMVESVAEERPSLEARVEIEPTPPAGYSQSVTETPPEY